MAKILQRGIPARARIGYICHRLSGILRGFALKVFLITFWGAKVGKQLTCFGWPRCILVLGPLEIGDDVFIGRDVTLWVGIAGNIRVGSRTSIGDYSVIHSEGGIGIGSNVMIAELVAVRDWDHGFGDTAISMNRQELQVTPVVIEDDVWLGRGAAVLRGSKVEHGCILGAHAVLSRKCLVRGSVAVGVPARVIRNRYGNP